VKLLLYSLDLVACMIIALSCILLLMRLDLFATCGVHRSYLLLVWLDLFTALCHIALVTIHVVSSWCSSPV
jgi:hypothetical protein